MRTTGVRCAPVPAPRPKQPLIPPQPLPRTRFLQKAASEKPPESPPVVSPDAPSEAPPEPSAQVTRTVISQSLAPPVKSKTPPLKTKVPPPKPPRSPGLKDSPPVPAASPVPRRPGLMEVLSRPNPSPPASPTQLQPARAAPLARPVPQGRGEGLGAVPVRRAPRPRLFPLSLPPPPTSVPPRPPPGTAPPRLPLRPTPAQLVASRARMGAPESRPASPRSVSVSESPVCSVEDFEDGCKEVFRNTRAAKDLASRGKHVQAASHYQVALTALDRVLRAQVLTLTQHEATRQRLFLLQQDVFNLRKEALHGFTDAQTAVRSPRGLSPTRPTPGAPPSYDDVLNEDRRRQRVDPRRSSRQSSSRGAATAGSTSGQRPPQGDKPPRLCPHPQANLTQVPAIQHPTACIRPQSTIESRVEELVGVLEPTTAPSRIAPSIAPSTSHVRAPRKPFRSSATRPKSSYNPSSQPGQPMSLPPPLLPISLPSTSLPSLQPQSPAPSLPPLPDEVLESQMKALQVFESSKAADVPPSQTGIPPSLSVRPGNLQEGKKAREAVGSDGGGDVTLLGDVIASEGGSRGEGRGERGGKAQAKPSSSSVSSMDDPFLSLDPLSSAKSQARRGEGGGGRDQTIRTIPTSSISSVDDPFLGLDPFPPVESMAQDSDVVFTEGSPASHIPSTDTDTEHRHSPAFSDDFTPDAQLNIEQKKTSHSPTMTQSPASCIPSTATTAYHRHSPAFSDNFTPLNAEQKGSHSPTVTQSPPDSLGDSILEALDFAITPTQGHRRVSPQSSRGRSYSEENLLDTSHNTLVAILNLNKDVYASRASIIEEFDPLVASLTQHVNQIEEEIFNEKERRTDHQDEGDSGGIALPRPVPRKTVYEGALAAKEEKEGSMYGSPPPDYCAEGGAVALAEVDDSDYYPTKRHPETQHSTDGARGRTSYSSDDSSSVLSWPPDLPALTPSTPASPLYPCTYPEEEEDEEEGEKGVDVGRSAFYLPPSDQGDGSRRRDLLRIREGVKIYFVHMDGVITSPWKKPFLAVYRDTSKAQLLGEGLVLSVGNNLWACELCKKATLVLRTQAGVYVFSEVAGKPECKAVCVRVPSSVRRPQQEFLSKILQQHTLMEEERPKGITKAISKGASSAATRMNKLVENSSMSPSQPFVRRNSMRALKGVTKRLNTIAERTGATMKELPVEYQALQEAADALALARSAKMIQYI